MLTNTLTFAAKILNGICIMKWKVSYYNQSLADEIRQCEKDIKAKFVAIADSILLDGPNLGMPFITKIREDLFELRIKGPRGTIKSVFYIISKNTIVFLHILEKKTEKIPIDDYNLIIKRMKEAKENAIQTFTLT